MRIRPALSRLPLAVLLAAFLADAAGTAAGAPALWVAGARLAPVGVALGAAAALADAADLVRSRRRALANLSALLLFALCWWVRGHPEVPPDAGVLLFEGVGAALLAVGAWLGRRSPAPLEENAR